MAHSNTSPSKKKQSVEPFERPTIFINCMSACSRCKEIEKLLTPELKKWAKEQGYDLVYNDDSSKASAYWKLYGKPSGIGQATPQIYIINGDDVKGGVIVPKEVFGYEVPQVKYWDESLIPNIFKALE